VELVILDRRDQPELLDYLDAHPDSTIWMRIAWYDGARFAAVRARGRTVGIAAHDKIGAVHVHTQEALAELARACVAPGARVSAVAGPPAQVPDAIVALGLGGRAVTRISREIIMWLDLDDLVVPELLGRDGIEVRRATEADLPLLTDWRIRYFQEVHRIAPDADALAEVRRDLGLGRLWVLTEGGTIVNTAAFNAVFSRLVQVEFAYSPPELRSKQFGRSAVAGALAAVRADGVRGAVLNTDENNLAVRVAAQLLGFRLTHEFRVIVFATE